MNLSELCIRRPVMAVLLSISLVLVGVLAYMHIPVAALPSYNTPVINVDANLPGASPETMASSVALPLEKQFSTIAGIKLITSTSTQGSTSLTLEFDTKIDVDKAAVDVQAALLAAQRQLPLEMTDLPSYRKVNPADAPILFMHMTSPSMGLAELNDYAENMISPAISTLPGIAQVTVNGQKRFAVRVRARSDLMNARNISMDELATALRAANSNAPLGVLDGPAQTLTIQGGAQFMKAADFAKLIVATRDGLPVRLQDVAACRRQLPVGQGRRQPERRTLDRADGAAPAEREHRAGGRRRARAAAEIRAATAGLDQDQPGERPLDLDPRSDPRRQPDAGRHHRAGDPGHLPVPAPPDRDPDPGRHRADLAAGRACLCCTRWATAWTTSPCWALRWPWAWWSTMPSWCWKTSCATWSWVKNPSMRP